MAAAKTMNAVVTGAGSGIGKALSLALASRGVRVIAVGRRPAPLEALAKEAEEGKIVVCSADLTTSAGVEAVSSAAKSTGSTIDYLVHNAGSIGPVTPLESLEVDDVRKTFEVNFFAPLALTKALLPSMTQPGGRILNISSGAANSAYPSWTTYCTSKAAFKMMWQCMNVELGGKGIMCGSVRPGIVATPMQDKIREVDEDKFPLSGLFRGFQSSMDEASKAAYEEHKIGVSKAGAPPPENALDTPENCAFFLQWLLLSTSDEEFPAEEWDIREKKYMDRWAEVREDAQGAAAGSGSGSGGGK